MTTYAVHRRTDAAEVYRYTADVVVDWGFDPATHTHDVVPDAAQPVPPARHPQQWPTLDFLLRFTSTERITAHALRATDPVLNDFFSLLDKSDIIHSDDKNTRRGMGYLVMLKVLTAERMSVILGDA